MSTLTIDPLIAGLHNVLDLRMAQHALTASNLANADTPGFRAREIDFEHALTEALEGSSRIQRTDPRHVGEGGGADPDSAPIVEIEPAPWAVDGNSVLPERETARMSTNALMYEAVSRGLTQKLALLRFAVSDGRS